MWKACTVQSQWVKVGASIPATGTIASQQTDVFTDSDFSESQGLRVWMEFPHVGLAD